MKYLLASAALLFSLNSMAQGLPGDPQEGEPDIRIYHKEDSTYYEYRINGQLKEIKIVPAVGKPYYMVPAQDGTMVKAEESTLMTPKWVIFRW